jgi:hypothetical protein
MSTFVVKIPLGFLPKWHHFSSRKGNKTARILNAQGGVTGRKSSRKNARKGRK